MILKIMNYIAMTYFFIGFALGWCIIIRIANEIGGWALGLN